MLDKIEKYLAENDWRKCNGALSAERSWYKRFTDVAIRCYCNSDKSGIVIGIDRYYLDMPHQQSPYISYELSLIAETKNGSWVNLRTYSISENDFLNILDTEIQKLIAAWSAMDNV